MNGRSLRKRSPILSLGSPHLWANWRFRRWKTHIFLILYRSKRIWSSGILNGPWYRIERTPLFELFYRKAGFVYSECLGMSGLFEFCSRRCRFPKLPKSKTKIFTQGRYLNTLFWQNAPNKYPQTLAVSWSSGFDAGELHCKTEYMLLYSCGSAAQRCILCGKLPPAWMRRKTSLLQRYPRCYCGRE